MMWWRAGVTFVTPPIDLSIRSYLPGPIRRARHSAPNQLLPSSFATPADAKTPRAYGTGGVQKCSVPSHCVRLSWRLHRAAA